MDRAPERIVFFRKQRGWTQEQLAKHAGVHKNTVLNAEQNGAIRFQTLRDLAEALGVTVADLVSETDNQSLIEKDPTTTAA